MDVPAAAVALGLGIRNLRMDQPDLEEVFMRALDELGRSGEAKP